MDAAATMGQIRNSLRAYALKGAGPGEVIDDLHALVDAVRAARSRSSTVVYVVLDLAHRRRASWPAPAICRRCIAAAARLRRRAALPAARASAAPTACTLGHFTLAPGETLWLFTDGLVESRRRPIDAGLAALARRRRPRRGRRSRRSPTSCSSTLPARARRRHRAARATPRRLGAPSASRRIRDTCICESPTRSAISRWTRSSTNRSRSTSRSRGGQRPPRAARSRARPRRGRARRPRGPSVSASPLAVLARHRRVEAGEPRGALGQPRLGDLLDAHAGSARRPRATLG